MQRSLRIAIVLAGILLLALLARRAMRASTASSSSSLGSVAPDLFAYRGTLEGHPPAPLPESRDDVFELSQHDVDGACEGDEGSLELLREHVAARWAPDAPDGAEQLEAARALPQRCFDPPSPPGVCAWAAAEIEGEGGLAAAAWALLTGCPPGVAAPFFDRADAPAAHVVAFVSRRRLGSPVLRPPARLPAQYARSVLELASAGARDASIVFGAAGNSIRYDDAAATERLAQAYASEADPAQRLSIVRGLSVLSNSRALELVQAACVSASTLPACAGVTQLESAEVLFDAASYVERHPRERPRVVADLERCVRGDTSALVGVPSGCLAHLATIDWARARTLASDLEPGADSALGGIVRSLRQFPSDRDLVLALRSRRLLGEPRARHAAPVTVAAAMVAYGRGWMLGLGSTSFAHDRLARHLATLGGIEDVEFDEAEASGGSSSFGLGRPTHLRATSRGDTFAVDALSDGDFYDLDAIVGLLNVVARARAVNVRYLVVVDPLAEEAVVLGPPGELASAVAEGLLEVPRVPENPAMPPF